MSMFQNARGIQISGGEFQVNNFRHDPTGIDILLAASTPDAAVDSRARQYAPSCFPGTREQYIADITTWATSCTTDQFPPIYWMKGPAGVGKSALAQTCAEKVKEDGLLGAAFFFSINGRDDPARLFTTLAYQLSTIFPDYRQILNDRVQNDKTLVEKKLSSQFLSLIVEPLRELEAQGRTVQRKAIFIDGLDECSSQDAQDEIIRIIGSSVQTKSTPFRWAIFSRPELRIAAAFDDECICAFSRCVELPVSRDADREIEVYLRAMFKNILRRRKLLHLSSTWPTNEDIEKLVVASAGLFAYPAAVLRFIDQHPFAGPMETLRAVLDAIVQPDNQQRLLPFSCLDKFYLLVMERIPQGILPSVLLFLACSTIMGFRKVPVAWYCSMLGFSDADFRSIINALSAVMAFQESTTPLTIDQDIDITRSYLEQHSSLQPKISLMKQLLDARGILSFHHKSFYDFLIDPVRSLVFCVASPTIRKQLFDRLVQRHHHFAQSYIVQGNTLASAPGSSNSPVTLSRPQRQEFVDSFIRIQTLARISGGLSHDSSVFARFLTVVPSSSLSSLAELDYRKSLIGHIMFAHEGLVTCVSILGFSEAAIRRRLADTVFKTFRTEKYHLFDPAAFLKMVKRMEDLGIIKPYHSYLPSTFAPVYQSLSLPKQSTKTRGRYKLGHGEKSVTWYWEFDTRKMYFHQFQTVNYLKAKRLYDTEKFKMWEESWVSPF